MRVAMAVSLTSPIRPAAANGPHRVVTDLARGLGARGHDVRIYAAEGSIVPDVDVVGIPVSPAVGRATFQPGRPRDTEAMRALSRGFSDLFDRVRADSCDVVSQHAFDAAAIEHVAGLPVLHTLHLPPLDPGVVAAARATGAELATVSSAAARAWRDVGVRIGQVLRNGVPCGPPPRKRILPVALIAGRISPEKGTHVAIRVARRAGLAVLVVGDAYDEDYHRRQVAPLLRQGEWIGPVPRDVLSEIMSRCAVLIMPIGWQEPFGLVAAEAQMAGCPVAGYRRGALPEVVADGIGGILAEPDDEDGLVAAVSNARGLDRSLVRERAQRELGVERMVSSYDAALSAIARPSLRLSVMGTS